MLVVKICSFKGLNKFLGVFWNIISHQFSSFYSQSKIMDIQKQEITLVEGQLKKIIHQAGEGEPPKKGQQIHALYKGTLQDGTMFDSNENRESPFTFVLGQGSVIKGWDQGFASMLKGEKATLICSPDYAYGARGSPPTIPPNATLNFEVELLGFNDKKKEKWEYSDEEKLSQAKNFKQSGNDKLKQGDYQGAVADYKEGIQFIEFEHAPETKQLLNILRLNISQAYLKLSKYSEAIDNCSKVLKEEEDCVKALFRRGVAYSRIQQFDNAKNDLKNVLKYDPQNVEAKKQIAGIAVSIKKQNDKDKKVFGNIFAKGGLYDDVKTTDIKPEVKKVDSEDEEGQIPFPPTPPHSEEAAEPKQENEPAESKPSEN